MKKIKRNMSNPESRAFWEKAEQATAEVEAWPDWKRAGINVAVTSEERREAPTAVLPSSSEPHERS